MDWRRKIVLCALILTATGMISAGLATPAQAVVISVPEFQVIESAVNGHVGQYTVINNSGAYGYSPEYIYGFSVTNPLANQGPGLDHREGLGGVEDAAVGPPKDQFRLRNHAGILHL